MVMVRRSTKTKSVKDWLEKATEKVDPITVAAMTLGGTATMLGITPPMTSILITLKNFTSADIMGGGTSTQGNWFASPFMPGLTLWRYQEEQRKKGIKASPTNPEGWGVEDIALFCSGAMEALITLELVRNKEFMKTLIGAGTTLGSAAIRAAGEAVPL